MEEYRKNFESVRRRANECLNKLENIQTGMGTPMDAAGIHGDVKSVEQAFSGLETQYKALAAQIEQGEARQLDEQLRYLRSRLQTLKINYEQYTTQGKREIEVDEADYEGGFQQAEELQERKNNQIDYLNEQAKILKNHELDINHEIVKGDEIVETLRGDVDEARDNVKASTGKVQQFEQYMKGNKVSFWSCILIILISVLLWSSKAFCSWGLTWECP